MKFDDLSVQPSVTFGVFERFGTFAIPSSFRLTGFNSRPDGIRALFCVGYGAGSEDAVVRDWHTLFPNAPLYTLQRD